MFDQYAEHLAHSAPCSSQWDGYDRGDFDYEPTEEEMGSDMAEYLEHKASLHDDHVDAAFFHHCETNVEAHVVEWMMNTEIPF